MYLSIFLRIEKLSLSQHISIHSTYQILTKLPKQKFTYSTVNSDLNNILLNMPRESKHTAELKRHREKIKQKGAKFAPGTVSLQVLGSGARGAPRSLYMFTDQSRYLFNCGEGVQRLAHEHKMKLAKLEHIFITYPSWENIGGLPGVALTIQDVGVPEITLHGPPGTDEIFSATRRFVILKDLSIRMASCKGTETFDDNVMTVQYVPLYMNPSLNSKSELSILSASENVESDVDQSDDETDYYAHERSKHFNNTTEKKKKDRSKSEGRRNSSIHEEHPAMSMCYVCRLKDRHGTLNLSACVDRGVPPGPLLGKLKSGEDVTLEDGRIVKSCDVTTPDDPGPVFIVVECPSEDYLDSLLKEPIFHRHQQNARTDLEASYLVVHFTPPDVMKHQKYQEWMDRFFPSTRHLVINSDNSCLGSVAVHRIQYKLNLLEPHIFPLLSDSGIPIRKEDGSYINGDETELKEDSLVPLLHGRTFFNVHLRPRTGDDYANLLYLTPEQYIRETYENEGFENELNLLREEIKNFEPDANGKYPKITFLGTGSCIPNKTRNTSGILVHVNEKETILLDCGESTYGQIIRFFGVDKSNEILSNLKAIFISHLHADHHIGLVGVLKGRKNALIKQTVEKSNLTWNKPVYLLAPKQIMSWLSLYHNRFEPILNEFEIIPNSFLHNLTGPVTKLKYSHFLEDLGMAELRTCPVRHCPNAFGISLKHDIGWKITYSGDTMPSQALVELGENSDILIHEATMEDELEHEARSKLHSTTSQAIDVGRQMNAKFILLTHFSQRYAKLPRLNERFTNNVGIAFDNMQVSLNQLSLLPKMYPALKLMFAEECEELETKAQKRQLREEKKRAASSSPHRKVKICV